MSSKKGWGEGRDSLGSVALGGEVEKKAKRGECFAAGSPE